MVCRNNTSHSSFSMTVITVLVVTAGALLFASCATSPRSEAGFSADSSEAGSSKTATDEKTTPSEPEKTEKTETTTPENGEAEAPGSDEAAAAPAAAEPPSRTQRHIQHLEDGLKPLRSIPSRRD